MTSSQCHKLLMMRLKLAEGPRRVAFCLGEFDRITTTDYLANPPIDIPERMVDVARVEFLYAEYREALGLYVMADGSYRVGMSACVGTQTCKEHLAAFVRAHRFINEYQLVPA